MRTATRPGGTGSTSGRARTRSFPAAPRNLVLVLLTMVSACADAISYLGLGHVFPANMTGNTVLLGIGLATGDLASAARSAAALGAFVLGAAAIGAAVPPRIPRGAARLVLVTEIGVLAAFCGWWAGTGAPAPSGGARYGLIALAGLAMGGQSALVRSLGVPAATTYITGTWTALSSGLAARRHSRDAQETTRRSDAGARRLQAAVLGTYLLTATAAAFAFRRLGAGATALPLGILLLAAIGAVSNPSALEKSEPSPRRQN